MKSRRRSYYHAPRRIAYAFRRFGNPNAAFLFSEAGTERDYASIESKIDFFIDDIKWTAFSFLEDLSKINADDSKN